MYLLADYEALDQLAWLMTGALAVVCLLVGVVAAAVLARVKRKWWHLCWAPAIGFTLFFTVAAIIALRFGDWSSR